MQLSQLPSDPSAPPFLARRVVWGLLTLLALTGAGVAGFALIEGASLLDALFMTVITLSTVGYSETFALSPGGRVFAIVLIVGGVLALGFTAAVLVEYLVGGHLAARVERRRRERALAALRGHFIVCGFGRVGEGIASDLHEAGRQAAVIDKRLTSCQRAEQAGAVVVHGNAHEAATLRTAGVDNAAAVLVATGNDAENVYTVLSVRAAAPHVPVIARASTPESVERLTAAGAARVFSPYAAGAQHMAAYVLQPHVAAALSELLDPKSPGMTIEEVALGPRSPFVGRSIADAGVRREQGVDVIAVGRGGSHTFLPSRSETLRSGDVLVIVGPLASVQRIVTAAAQPSR